MKTIFILSFLLLLQTFGYSQDPLLIRHVKSDSFNYTVYVKSNSFKIKRYNDSLHYYWYKSQRIMMTQGGSSGIILDGHFIKYFKGGQLAERGNIKAGVRNGAWKTWYNNGDLKTVSHYRNGKKHGVYYALDESGSLTDSGKYKNGKEVPVEESMIMKLIQNQKRSKKEKNIEEEPEETKPKKEKAKKLKGKLMSKKSNESDEKNTKD